MIDGNKRIRVHAMLVFMALNGYEVEYTQIELSDLILDVAAERKQYEDILQRLVYSPNRSYKIKVMDKEMLKVGNLGEEFYPPISTKWKTVIPKFEKSEFGLFQK